MMETMLPPTTLFQPYCTRSLQEGVRAGNIRCYELVWRINRPINVALGSKMDKRIDIFFTQKAGYQFGISNIAANELDLIYAGD